MPDDAANGASVKSDDPPPDLPGYDVIQRLGAGGMGRVYRVRHRLMNQERVVKTIHAEQALHPQLHERFLREIRIGAQLRHPNIVEVHDAWVRDGVGYLAMEYFPGRNLAQWYGNRPAPTDGEVVALARGIADGLAFAHVRDIVHRDMKPQNVLMDEAGRVKIIDFGLASIADGGGHGKKATSLTLKGAIIGTPNCMAPEQIFAPAKVGPLSDLYGLGCVLYFCLAGRYPHEGRSVLEVARLISKPYPKLSSLRPAVAPALEAAIDQLLRQRPRDRFPSALALRDALDAILPPTDYPGLLPLSPADAPAAFSKAATLRLPAAAISAELERSRRSAAVLRPPSGSFPRTPISAQTSSSVVELAGHVIAELAAAKRQTDIRDEPPAPDGAGRPCLRAYAPEHGWLEYSLTLDEEVLLGRSATAAFCLPGESISRRHAIAVLRASGLLELRDIGSSHGMAIGGRRMEATRLRHGEAVQLACFMIEFDDGRPDRDPVLVDWARRGIRPLPPGMRAEWSPLNASDSELASMAMAACPGGVLIELRPEPPPGALGKILLAWPDAALFTLPAYALETAIARRGRLTALRLYPPLG